MADKSISELSTISAITGDECFYGIQSNGDVKIVADDLVDYILNTYEFNSDVTNSDVIAGKINSLRTITDISDLADKTYPIGSLYWSSSSTSPASLLGGVWARVKDRFALAAGSSYTAGTNGGEAVHTLTISEFPSHAHNTNTGGPSNNTSAASSATNTGDTDTAHTHSIPKLSGTAAENGNHTHTPQGSLKAGYGHTDTSTGVVYDITNGSVQHNWSSAGAHTHTVSINSGWLTANTATHTHSLQNHTHSLSAHTHTISSQGEGGQHNNMPPYVVYYCWERIE